MGLPHFLADQHACHSQHHLWYTLHVKYSPLLHHSLYQSEQRGGWDQSRR